MSVLLFNSQPVLDHIVCEREKIIGELHCRMTGHEPLITQICDWLNEEVDLLQIKP